LLEAIVSKLPPESETLVTTQHLHSKLVSPDYSVDPAVSVDNDGNSRFYGNAGIGDASDSSIKLVLSRNATIGGVGGTVTNATMKLVNGAVCGYFDANEWHTDANAMSWEIAATGQYDWGVNGGIIARLSASSLQLIAQELTIGTINAHSSAATVYLTAVAGLVKSRTAAQVLSDIGAVASSHTHSKLVASDGSPDPALSIDATGNATFYAAALFGSGVNGSIRNSSDSASMAVQSATSNLYGPGVEMYGRDHATLPGQMYLSYGGYNDVGSLTIRHREDSSWTTVAHIDSSGNFGLKTDSPATALDVNGEATVRTINAHGSAATTYLTAVSGVIKSRTAAQVLSDIGAAAASHAHSAADITSGTLAVARGGTGIASYTVGNYIYASGATTLAQYTAAQVLSNIGAAAATHYHDAVYFDTTGSYEMLSYSGNDFTLRSKGGVVALSSVQSAYSLDVYADLLVLDVGSGSGTGIIQWRGSADDGPYFEAHGDSLGFGIDGTEFMNLQTTHMAMASGYHQFFPDSTSVLLGNAAGTPDGKLYSDGTDTVLTNETQNGDIWLRLAYNSDEGDGYVRIANKIWINNDGDLIFANDKTAAPTDNGAWLLKVNGTDFVHYRRESDSWVAKNTITD
jgi:hypothetical protein